MTRIETARICAKMRPAQKRRRCDPILRDERAIFMMGYIQSCFDLETLFDRSGHEDAKLLADLMRYKQSEVRKQLRRL